MKSDRYDPRLDPDPVVFNRITKEQQEKSDKLLRNAKRAEEKRNRPRPWWKRFLGIGIRSVKSL